MEDNNKHFQFEDELTSEEVRKIEELSKSVTKMFHDTFKAGAGKACLQHLKEIYVERQLVRPMDTQFEAALRQGEANIVLKIIEEVNKDI